MKLPEPVAWELLFNNGNHDDVTTDKGEANEYGENKVPLYTEAQMRQAIKDAYEEAAKVCDEHGDLGNLIYAGTSAIICAEAIRKLGESL